MRSVFCILMLALCLFVWQCTAEGGGGGQLEQGEGSALTNTAAPKSGPQGGNEKQDAPNSEVEVEPEVEVDDEDVDGEEDDSDRQTAGKPQAKVDPPPVDATVTTTTVTTVKTGEVAGTINNALSQPKKPEQDSLLLSHGAQKPAAPMQPKFPSKPEEGAHAQPQPKPIPKKTVPASGSKEQNYLHRDVKTTTGEGEQTPGRQITAGKGQSTAVKDPDALPKDSLDKAGGIHTHKVNNTSADATTTSTAQATEKNNKNAEKTTTTTVSPTTAISSVQTTSLQQEPKLLQSAANKDGSSSTSLLIAFAILGTLSVIPAAPAY